MKSTLATVVILLVAVLAIGVVPSNAAVQVNDKTVISLTVFVPCAAGGAGEIVDLSGPLHTLISFTINDRPSTLTRPAPVQILRPALPVFRSVCEPC
jgi:hypothetical protein